jgi:hypothetical protein
MNGILSFYFLIIIYSIFVVGKRKTSIIFEFWGGIQDNIVVTDSTQQFYKFWKQVGIHQPHAYSRSLARFATKFSPAGWDIVARRIEKVLPPGTKFGRSWAGETEESQETDLPK